MFETWETAKRIDEAKRITKLLVDHALYLLAIHENNAVVLYSATLSKQIPKSYAANAFNIFREGMHQIEIVRLCGLWDAANIDNESIPTVIELIDHKDVLVHLAEVTKAQHSDEPTPFLDSDEPNDEDRKLIDSLIKRSNEKFGQEQADRAVKALEETIKAARNLRTSTRVISLRNLRNKKLAHFLTETAEEKKNGPVDAPKYGDERIVLEASLSIIQTLYLWVNGVSLSFKDSQAIQRKYSDALWGSCSFSIESRDRTAATQQKPS